MTRGQSVVHGVVALTIPAKAEYIVLSRLALSGLARARALGAGAGRRSEAGPDRGLLERGPPCLQGAASSGEVEVRYELDEDKLSVEVVDEGIGFDPEAAVAAAGDELDEGGLGISIIRAIVDELDIKSSGSGSSLRFTKYLA